MVAGETLPGAREVEGVKSSPAVLPEPVAHIRAVVRLALGMSTALVRGCHCLLHPASCHMQRTTLPEQISEEGLDRLIPR